MIMIEKYKKVQQELYKKYNYYNNDSLSGDELRKFENEYLRLLHKLNKEYFDNKLPFHNLTIKCLSFSQYFWIDEKQYNNFELEQYLIDKYQPFMLKRKIDRINGYN